MIYVFGAPLCATHLLFLDLSLGYCWKCLAEERDPRGPDEQASVWWSVRREAEVWSLGPGEYYVLDMKQRKGYKNAQGSNCGSHAA